MNILFICSANRDRSRTAELHFQAKYPDHRFRSAGINKYLSERHGGIHVQRYMIDNADRIICAENVHRSHIVERFGGVGDHIPKLEVLELGDTEKFMSEQLINLLEEKFKMK